MDLSIIIVSWNTRDLLHACVQSIYNKTRGVTFEIFVIDNASQDGSVEMMRENFAAVKTIANTTNRGFAAANNQGIKLASGRYIVLLNPDTKLLEDSFCTMVSFMDAHAQCGIGGCRLLNPDGTEQASVRRFPTLLDQMIILLKLHHLFHGFSRMRAYLCGDFDYTRTQSVDQVMGACFMARDDVFKRVGLLDEGFFNWFEEVDFCKRTKMHGYDVYYISTTSLVHHFGQSFNQLMPVSKQRMWNRSLRHYFYKHHSKIVWLIVSFISWLSVGISYLIQNVFMQGSRKARKF